jgi:uncharacterized membrane protein YphA (DoxX/SURF4 family)
MPWEPRRGANKEAGLVHHHSRTSINLIRIKDIFHRTLANPWPYRIIRIALASLFIYGGVTKLFDPKAFAATISAYDLVPEMLLPVIAIGLPIIETVAGLALLSDRPWGLHLITGLLILFVFVLGYGIVGDLDVDCGCFGEEELNKQAGLRVAFYRDLVLIGIVTPYLYLSRRVRELVRNRGQRGMTVGE